MPAHAKATFKIVTANRLADGEVVWLGHNEVWVETIESAWLLEDESALEAGEAAATRAVALNRIVDVEVIDVRREGGAIVPVRLRERIRAAGPTFRKDLGKQSRRASDAA
ncbi:DUF2849 domain-containing protein [Breoghania sp.]|uniref:DUF2849 domain-containing protein n=1 Tax=Breoghania sp. TaxID=2065378 RepID=UPI0029CA3AAD|nr:DUF2849 domain-containing protein [Breoghania sp.]